MSMDFMFRALQPVEFLSKFLAQGIRPDGRGVHKSRETTINVGSISTAEGSAIVRTGETVAVCGVKAELTNPSAKHPNEGFVLCNVEMPPLCSPHVQPGPPSPSTQALTQTLQDVLVNSATINLEDLCIESHKLCWVLYVDVVCLCDDGGVMDACVLAMSSALHNTSLPHVDVSSGSPVVSLEERCALCVRSFPVSISFGFFQNKALLDPCGEEEKVCRGKLSVAMQEGGKVLALHKTGGSVVAAASLMALLSLAQERAQVLVELVRTATKKT